jgi:hypothetical protein
MDVAMGLLLVLEIRVAFTRMSSLAPAFLIARRGSSSIIFLREVRVHCGQLAALCPMTWHTKHFFSRKQRRVSFPVRCEAAKVFLVVAILEMGSTIFVVSFSWSFPQ